MQRKLAKEDFVVDAREQTNEEIWSRFHSCLNSVTEATCGYSKNHPWRKETWWWNAKVAEAITEKRKRFKVFKKLRTQKKNAEALVAKTAYQDAKRAAKHKVWLAQKEADSSTFGQIGRNDPGIYRASQNNFAKSNVDCRHTNNRILFWFSNTWS